MTHTPGNWGMVYGTDGHHHLFAADGPIAIVSVQADADRQESNALLLLHAPDLLAALRRAVDTIRAFHGLGLPAHAEVEMWKLYQQSPEMRAINDAIAKVEGKAAQEVA